MTPEVIIIIIVEVIGIMLNTVYVSLKVLISWECCGTMALCSKERQKTFYKHVLRNWTTSVATVTSSGNIGGPYTSPQGLMTCAIILSSTERASPRVTASKDISMYSGTLRNSFYTISSFLSMWMVGSLYCSHVAIKVRVEL